MHITQSSISLSSAHSSRQTLDRQESLSIWGGGARPGSSSGKGTVPESLPGAAPDKVSLHAPVRRSRDVRGNAPGLSDRDRVLADLNMRILQKFIERCTGKAMRFSVPVEREEPPGDELGVDTAVAADGPAQGWGIEYQYSETYRETESTRFSAHGVIQTAEGLEVEFSVDVQMSREFVRENHLDIRLGDALKDPLVVNFEGNAAELRQDTFSFDIDADGMPDQVRFVGPQSGFLALDSNDDGVINDGRELFGALSGSGFADLARYDDDGNNWIDAEDAIYDRLRIWSRDAEGQDRLLALGQHRIGALYLGHVSTPFSIKDQENALLGQVRDSGIFLHADGRAGSMQQLDLVV